MKARKTLVGLIVVTVFILCLMGCGSKTQIESEPQAKPSTSDSNNIVPQAVKAPKDATAIQKDYEENTTIFEEHGGSLRIQDFVITKRRTDEASYTDTVYITATMVSEDGLVQVVQDCTITYGLYNDGWVLDSVDSTATQWMPLYDSAYSEEELVEALRDRGYSGVSELSVSEHIPELEEWRDYYRLTFTDVHKYMTRTVQMDLFFYFDPIIGWSVYNSNSTINSSEEEWHIDGTYRYGDTETTIAIPYVTPTDNMVLSYSGKADYECQTLYSTKEFTLTELAFDIAAEIDRDYISFGYSVRMWDGQDRNYSKLNYTDFTYLTGIRKGTWWIDALLIGPDHMAILPHNRSKTDPVNHIVYIEITELLDPNKAG